MTPPAWRRSAEGASLKRIECNLVYRKIRITSCGAIYSF